jgi:hypothetical protein
MAAPAGPVRPDPGGAALCADQGEGTQTARYASGTIKMRVVCRETEDSDGMVRYGWYFDATGREVREEDLVAGHPDQSRITLKDYEGFSTEPSVVRTYDGNGRLTRSTTAAETAPIHGAGTYTDYLTYCQESPGEMLYPLLGAERDPQFFTKKACACVAAVAVKQNDSPATGVWKRQKTLNPDNPQHRTTVAALSHLSECLCPDVFPESHLEELCQHAAEIEGAWQP